MRRNCYAPLVKEFLTRWIDTVAVEIKPTTHANYTVLAHAYVIPYIGHRKMRDIKPQTISELYRRLLLSGRRKRDTNTIMFEHWKRRTKAGHKVTGSELAHVAGLSQSAGIRAVARYRAGRYPSALSAGLGPKSSRSLTATSPWMREPSGKRCQTICCTRLRRSAPHIMSCTS